MEKTDRITVVERVYHHRHKEQPTSIESTFVRWLKTSDQPYQRESKATLQWKPLKLGWIEAPSIIMVQNRSKAKPEHEEEYQADHVYLRLEKSADVLLVIPPGESLRITPTHWDEIDIRCEGYAGTFALDHTIKILIHVTPE